jgi:hypothetical protein
MPPEIRAARFGGSTTAKYRTVAGNDNLAIPNGSCPLDHRNSTGRIQNGFGHVDLFSKSHFESLSKMTSLGHAAQTPRLQTDQSADQCNRPVPPKD